MTIRDVLISAAGIWLLLGLTGWIAATVVQGARLERSAPKRKHPHYGQAALSALLMVLMGPIAWVVLFVTYRQMRGGSR